MSLALEKEKKLENSTSELSLDAANGDLAPTFDEPATRRLVRKLDLNIVPFMALLYLYAVLLFGHGIIILICYLGFHSW